MGRGVGKGWARFDRDESGAILLLGLAGILILMMLAWVLYDAGQMSRDKLDVQTAADTAAYSQAAVKARAMNNLAYANIAKRSVVGIHSQYWALWQAYNKWVEESCPPSNDSASCRTNRRIHASEQSNDLETFLNENGDDYYLQDIIAIDNYQRYIHALTPWWGWAEAVHRAARNGATMAASFPAPTGAANGNAIVNSITNRVINQVGWTPLVRYTGHRAMLPVVVSNYRYMLEDGMGPERSFYEYEYDANIAAHRRASQGAAGSDKVVKDAFAYFPRGVLRYSQDVFGNAGRPWKLFDTAEPARWTTRTSNLVITYRHNEELFDEMRGKYDFLENDYSLEDEEKFRSTGYWGMARGEISFQGGFRTPDLWHPRWTARLRPVALPGEFQNAGIQLASIYHDMLPYLALSGILITGDSRIVNDSIDDMVFMERATRALGHSTVEGIAK
jgi:hypothetical protein